MRVSQLSVLTTAFAMLILTGCKSEEHANDPRGNEQGEEQTSLPINSNVVMTNVAVDAGLQWTRSFGDDKLTTILEDTGSGIAWIDFDNDGLLDIYLLSGSHVPGYTGYLEGEKPLPGRSALYRNNGDGTFSDSTDIAGVGFEGYAVGALVGDYDLDGDEDLFLCNFGPNVLYQNNGDGTFTDVAEKLGLQGAETLEDFPKWSTSAIWFDMDGDRDLDLYVANYLAFDPSYRSYYLPEGMPGPTSYLGQPSFLYRNDNGSYTEVGEEAGIRLPGAKAMGIGAADFDGDGDLDIFQANDATRNYLFVNDGKGHFHNVAYKFSVAYSQSGEFSASMHASWGDFNHDGWFDLYVPDIKFGGLFENLQGKKFEDITLKSGVAAVSGQYSAWGADFADFDNDGNLDLYIANGKFHHLFPEQDLLLLGDGAGVFQDVTNLAGDWFRVKRVSRGGALADFDNDGDMDALFNTNEVHGEPVLLRNDQKEKRNWLGIKLLSKEGSPDPIGAKVRVTSGSLTQTAQMQRVRSYLSSSDPRLHFGLGDGSVDAVEVLWPGGEKTTLGYVPANQYITIQEGKGRVK